MAREKEGLHIEDDGITGAESDYTPKTDKEIRELALAIRAGTVFGTWSIPEYERSNIGMVFMPIMFADDIAKKRMIRNKIVHFYGHLSDAFERSLNGMPMFKTVYMLDENDTTRVNAALKLLAEFMGDDEKDAGV